MSAAQQSPFQLLQGLDSRCRAQAPSLPQQVVVRDTWDGVGFRIGELPLVAPMKQVKEILTQVSLCRLPGAKSWVMGVANVRGTLLPVLDLRGLLQGQASRSGRLSRVLVLNHHGIQAGLLVDEVLGMRHFPAETFDTGLSGFPPHLHKYLHGTYPQDESRWAVIDLHRLVDMPEFADVAA